MLTVNPVGSMCFTQNLLTLDPCYVHPALKKTITVCVTRTHFSVPLEVINEWISKFGTVVTKQNTQCGTWLPLQWSPTVT